MKALSYLLWRSIVNKLKSLKKQKGALIFYIAIVALLIVAVAASGSNVQVPTQIQNMDGFAAILNGVFIFIFVISASTSLKQGTAIFSMSDVNLLFTSPVNPRRILIFGALRQAGVLALASLFLLFQYPNIRMNCGLGFEALAGLMIGYVFIGVFTQLFNANVYALCASNPKLRRYVEGGVRVVVAVICVLIIKLTMDGGNIIESAKNVLSSYVWDYIPVIGWCKAIAIYASYSMWGKAALFIGLMLLSCAAMLLWLVKSKADFYEDVLLAAENAYKDKSAANDGKMVNFSKASKHAKRELPPLKGKGASAFFYRAIREQSRNASWLFGISTIAAVIAPVFGAIIFKDGADISDGGLFPVLAFGAYMLIFMMMAGGVGKELTIHYLFVAPSTSFKKLVAITLPPVIKFSADTVVFFGVLMLVVKPPLDHAILASIAYFSFGAIYSAATLLIEKFLGSMQSKVAIIVLYLLILLALMAPGFIVSIILYQSLGCVAYLIDALWNVLVSLLIVFICRNLLNEIAK